MWEWLLLLIFVALPTTIAQTCSSDDMEEMCEPASVPGCQALDLVKMGLVSPWERNNTILPPGHECPALAQRGYKAQEGTVKCEMVNGGYQWSDVNCHRVGGLKGYISLYNMHLAQYLAGLDEEQCHRLCDSDPDCIAGSYQSLGSVCRMRRSAGRSLEDNSLACIPRHPRPRPATSDNKAYSIQVSGCPDSDYDVQVYADTNYGGSSMSLSGKTEFSASDLGSLSLAISSVAIGRKYCLFEEVAALDHTDCLYISGCQKRRKFYVGDSVQVACTTGPPSVSNITCGKPGPEGAAWDAAGLSCPAPMVPDADSHCRVADVGGEHGRAFGLDYQRRLWVPVGTNVEVACKAGRPSRKSVTCQSGSPAVWDPVSCSRLGIRVPGFKQTSLSAQWFTSAFNVGIDDCEDECDARSDTCIAYQHDTKQYAYPASCTLRTTDSYLSSWYHNAIELVAEATVTAGLPSSYDCVLVLIVGGSSDKALVIGESTGAFPKDYVATTDAYMIIGAGCDDYEVVFYNKFGYKGNKYGPISGARNRTDFPNGFKDAVKSAVFSRKACRALDLGQLGYSLKPCSNMDYSESHPVDCSENGNGATCGVKCEYASRSGGAVWHGAEWTCSCCNEAVKQRKPMDVLLVLDHSGTSCQSLDEQKEYMTKFLRGLDIRSGGSRVAVGSYGADATLRHSFTDMQSCLYATAAINGVEEAESRTSIADGIQLYEQVFVATKRPSVPQILILATDGMDTAESMDPNVAIAEARSAGVTLLFLPVGNDYSPKMLEDLAGGPNFVLPPDPNSAQAAATGFMNNLYHSCLSTPLKAVTGAACYTADLTPDRVTYVEARTACESLGGSLATLQNRGIFDAVVKGIPGSSSVRINTGYLWVGLEQDQSATTLKGGWHWVHRNGTEMPMTGPLAALWNPSEPNDCGGSGPTCPSPPLCDCEDGSENAAVLAPTDGFIDVRASGLRRPLCEFPIPKTCPVIPRPYTVSPSQPVQEGSSANVTCPLDGTITQLECTEQSSIVVFKDPQHPTMPGPLHRCLYVYGADQTNYPDTCNEHVADLFCTIKGFSHHVDYTYNTILPGEAAYLLISNDYCDFSTCTKMTEIKCAAFSTVSWDKKPPPCPPVPPNYCPYSLAAKGRRLFESTVPVIGIVRPVETLARCLAACDSLPNCTAAEHNAVDKTCLLFDVPAASIPSLLSDDANTDTYIRSQSDCPAKDDPCVYSFTQERLLGNTIGSEQNQDLIQCHSSCTARADCTGFKHRQTPPGCHVYGNVTSTIYAPGPGYRAFRRPSLCDTNWIPVPACPQPSGSEFACPGSGGTVPASAICDGKQDCPGNSDEAYCDMCTECPSQGCPDGSCVRDWSQCP